MRPTNQMNDNLSFVVIVVATLFCPILARPLIFGRNNIGRTFTSDADIWDWDSNDLYQMLLREGGSSSSDFEVVMNEMSTALRRDIGEHATIWGIKKTLDDRSSIVWELYWVTDGDLETPFTASDVARATSRWIDWKTSGCDLEMLDELVARDIVTMFSIDIDAEVIRTGILRDGVNVYVEEADKSALSRFESRSYNCDARGCEIRNSYASFELANMSLIEERIRRSKHYSPSFAESDFRCALMRPELVEGALVHMKSPSGVSRRSTNIYVDHASKPRCDGLYFSGIGIEELLSFFRVGPTGLCEVDLAARESCTRSNPNSSLWGWPERLLVALEKSAGQLASLRFDVGFDYRLRRRNETSGEEFFARTASDVEFLRSAFYGTF